jgi:hypothetical protein
MRELGAMSRPRRALAALVLAVWGLSAAGTTGCSLVLDTDTNPYQCSTDQDCTRYPDAACDSVRKMCVPRLPPIGSDGGAPPDGPGALTCELSFDNNLRVLGRGPDGGLLPLPEGP